MIQCCQRQRFMVIALAFGGFCLQGMTAYAADLRDAAPPEAYMAIWGTKNPERDYLKAHEQAVWDEVAKSKIFCKRIKFIHAFSRRQI